MTSFDVFTVDLSSWHDKLAHEMTGREQTVATQVALEENTGDHHAHQAFQDGVLTLGCCGYPNVGKSSLINGLMGRKVHVYLYMYDVTQAFALAGLL